MRGKPLGARKRCVSSDDAIFSVCTPERMDSYFMQVILLRFKEDVDEATKAEVVKQVRSLDTRPSVARIRMGETFTTDRAGEYTHALTVALPSREALAEYSNDEEHLRVKRDYLAPNVEKLVCLDIEDGKAGDKSDVPTWIRCPFTRTVAFSTVALAGFVLGRYRR